jgi:sugar lactone lactonase YvrE
MTTQSMQRLTVSEPFLRLGCLLAEGPFYRPEDDTVHFVDIKGKLLYRVPLSGSPPPRALSTEDMLGVACLIEGDNENYLVAAKRGFGIVNQESGKLTYLAKVFPNADEEKKYSTPVSEWLTLRMRFNDGAIDCMGRFWAGAMCE